jgi:hypothetical protein
MFRKNPFTMLGRIDRCWLFVYQTPAEEARALVPPELELVTRGGCAFWNIVVCHLSAMRPQPLPAWLGFSYWHIAYRLYVRFRPPGGKMIEGVYFVRSDCNSPLMTVVGNWLTDFNFHTAGLELSEKPPLLHVAIQSPDAPAAVTLDREKPPRLPAHSVFSSLEEAAAFLKYKPFGISWERGPRRCPLRGQNAAPPPARFGHAGGTPALPGRANVVAITRDEAAWKSRLVTVVSADWKFFEGKTVCSEICYEVEPIAYQWNRGRICPGAPRKPGS